MSRTVRRVGKSLNPIAEASWVEEDNWEYIETHKWRWGRMYYPRQFLQGKEYRKGWWMFHADHHRRHHRNNRLSWSSVRMANKHDLCKWAKDDTHEPFFEEDANKKDWD